MNVSVIVPTYRSPESVGRVVAAVTSQLGPDDELVVVDDGSGDATPDVVAAAGDHRLRLVVQDNRGVSAARNRGLAQARNALVVFLDDDELPEPGWLDAHRRAHDGDRRLAVMGRAILMVPGRGGLRAIPQAATPPTQLVNDSFSVRRSDLEAVGGFDERFVHGGEDVDLGLRLRADGVELAREPAAVIRHEIDRSYRDFRRQRIRRGQASVRMRQVHDLGLLPARSELGAVDRLLAATCRNGPLVEVVALALWGLVRVGGWVGSWPLQAAAAGRATLLLARRAEDRAALAGRPPE